MLDCAWCNRRRSTPDADTDPDRLRERPQNETCGGIGSRCTICQGWAVAVPCLILRHL